MFQSDLSDRIMERKGTSIDVSHTKYEVVCVGVVLSMCRNSSCRIERTNSTEKTLTVPQTSVLLINTATWVCFHPPAAANRVQKPTKQLFVVGALCARVWRQHAHPCFRPAAVVPHVPGTGRTAPGWTRTRVHSPTGSGKETSTLWRCRWDSRTYCVASWADCDALIGWMRGIVPQHDCVCLCVCVSGPRHTSVKSKVTSLLFLKFPF